LLSQYAPLWEDISSSTTVPQSHLCTVAVETSLTLFPTEQKKVLDPAVFKEFPLTEKTILSHNTAIYRFALPTPNSILGLPIGQHISIAANLDVKDPKTETVTNKEVVRSYTPISSDVDPGYFDLLIKSYPTGNISRHLATLKIGDKMKVKGPKGAMVYTPNMVRHFGMIAGGTGITPMLQVAKAIIRGRSSGDKTQVDLIFANVNEEDILMKQDLDKLTREDSGFRVHYVLNNPPEGWTGGVGFVTGDMIKVRSKDSFVASASELIACNRNFSPPLPRTSRSSFAAHLPWSAP
jgi:cytochrome-b5 reductase